MNQPSSSRRNGLIPGEVKHMIPARLIIMLSLLCGLFALTEPAGAKEVHHYVYFCMEREAIPGSPFLHVKALEGAQVTYAWKQLETGKDHYDFSLIREDLEFLSARGKRLFIQIQDVTFTPGVSFVPRYLREEKEYSGGDAVQYGDDGAPAGMVARRWDANVRRRFHLLLGALGKEFDGKITGVNLPETAVEPGMGTHQPPPGFSFESYRDGIMDTMKALRKSFPRSVTVQYTNFMPGEWLPGSDHSYMRSIFSQALRSGVGLGGPDLLPWKKGQMNNGYSFIRQVKGAVPVAMAIQEGNYGHVNPKTGKRVTIPELVEFGTGHLGADYLFWCTEEPYFSSEVIPYFEEQFDNFPFRWYDR